MASSKPSPSSFPNLLLSVLNLVLFTLSATSAGPTVLLRRPPTKTGAAFLAISAASSISALVGLMRRNLAAHLLLLLASLAGQILGALALFASEDTTLMALGSPCEPRLARQLARLECGALAAMVLVQVAVLVLTCIVRCGLETGFDDVAAMLRWCRRGVRVQEEPVSGDEARVVQIEEKLRKYVQWAKNDFEG